MRKRTRNLAVFLIALAALLAGVAYDASTHVVRGWLRGEAFFDGRPTSYWCQEVDRWIDRHPSREEAERCEWRILHFNRAEDEHARVSQCQAISGPQRNHVWDLYIRYYPRATMWERAGAGGIGFRSIHGRIGIAFFEVD